MVTLGLKPKEGTLTMSGHALTRLHASRRPAAVPAMGWLSFLAEMLRAMQSRKRLAEMDDRMLKDIGVSRAEAFEEANRAPWDIGQRG